MNVESIVQYLSVAADPYAMPGYWFWGDPDAPGAAARLRCYASETRWLIVGERLYYDRDQWGQHSAFVRAIGSYGNGAQRVSKVFESVVSDGDAPLFVYECDDEGEATTSTINPSATNLRIRAARVEIPRDPALLSLHSVSGHHDQEANLYRALCSVPQVRNSLFATQEEVRQALGIYDDLSEILILDNWAAPEDPEGFAKSECAGLLAQTMVYRDARRYQPTEPANMHWRHHLTQL